MSNGGVHRGVRRVALPWRRVCATLPAVALIGGGIALANPAPALKALSISKYSPAIVVPGTALTIPPVPAGTGGMVSAVPGTTLAGEYLEMERALSAGAGLARAMPPPIRATAGRVAQTLRHGRAILRTPRWTPPFDMAFSFGEILLQGGAPCR